MDRGHPTSDEALLASGLQKWKRLERLRSGPDEDAPERIAAGGHHGSPVVDHGHVAAVNGLHASSAEDADQGSGGCHGRLLSERVPEGCIWAVPIPKENRGSLLEPGHSAAGSV